MSDRNKRLKKSQRIPHTIDADDFYGTIEQVVDRLTALEAGATLAGYQNIRIESGYVYGCDVSFHLVGDHLETDEEYERRLKRQKTLAANRKKSQEKRKEEEIKTLKKLAKKHKIKIVGE